MGNVININDRLRNNLKKDIFINNVNNDFEKDLASPKNDNYKFLIENYEKVTRKLQRNYLSKDKFDLFYEKLTGCMARSYDRGDKFLTILLFYKLFDLYKLKLLEKSVSVIHVMISVLTIYNEEEVISDFDKALDFMFVDDITKKINELYDVDKELFHFMIEVIESYIENPNIPTACHALFYMEGEKIDKVYSDNEAPELYIPNIKNMCKKVIEQIEGIITLYETQNATKIINDYANRLSMFELKISEIPEEERENCFYFINSILNENDISIFDKVDIIFNEVDRLYELSHKKI